MTQAEQVTLRYNYVMQATSNAHGDFARTADSASNQLRVLVESLKELALEFGNELIPVILPVIEQLKGLVQTFSEMEDWQKKLVVHTNELKFVCIYTLKQLILKKLLVIYKKVEFDMRIYKNINDKK